MSAGRGIVLIGKGAGLLACALLGCMGLVLIFEALDISMMGTGLASEEYHHFGSESMISHGGWAYRSRGNYIISTGGLGLLWCATASAVTVAVLRSRFMRTAIALSALSLLALIRQVTLAS